MTETTAGRVLILEDDEGIAQLERRRLERAGYVVLISQTVEKARDLLIAGGIDVLILDYKLTGSIDGLEFHRQLDEQGLRVPSILVTAYAAEAILAKAIRAGIRDFLPKKNDEFLDFLGPAVERVMSQVRVEKQLEEERAARQAAEAEKRTLAEEDRRKDEFLAMLAHELRNPLSAIASAVQLARATPTVEQSLWSNDVISRQVGHLSHLIDDLLDVSRIRQGKIQLRKVSLEVTEIVRRAIETVNPSIQSRHHVLNVKFEPGESRVDADATRLEQVLVNLLTNAAKYTPDGGQIGLSVSREAGHVVVRVMDTGIGISAELLPNIFDLFIQAEDSLDRSNGGLGIGLTLVRTLVTMHGGTIVAESEGPGKGSQFTIRLLESARAMETVLPSTPKRSQHNGRRVLVVDDNADSVSGMARFLRLSGHSVEVAQEGLEALCAAKTILPEVILLDIGLPGMNGYQLATKLRAEGFEAAKIIAVSGYGQDEDRRKSHEAGFDAHLVKPIDLDLLLTMIAS